MICPDFDQVFYPILNAVRISPDFDQLSYAKGFRGASDRQSYVEMVVIWNKKRSNGQCDLILQNLKQYKFIGNKKEP